MMFLVPQVLGKGLPWAYLVLLLIRAPHDRGLFGCATHFKQSIQSRTWVNFIVEEKNLLGEGT